MALTGSVLLVGAGMMGQALVRGWLARFAAGPEILIVEPDPGHRAALPRQGVRVFPGLDDLPLDVAFGPLVLAVKPQIMDQILPLYRNLAGRCDFVLSIAAGKTLGYFRGQLGDTVKIIRAMPNLPAAVGSGATVAVAGSRIGAAERQAADALLAAVGSVHWIADESLLDPITALSGSGPAYVFLVAERMTQAAIELGVPAELAEALARETIIGAAKLMESSSDSAAVLRERVTSPGGTTRAALDVFQADDALAHLFTQALAAAARRSRELAD